MTEPVVTESPYEYQWKWSIVLGLPEGYGGDPTGTLSVVARVRLHAGRVNTASIEALWTHRRRRERMRHSSRYVPDEIEKAWPEAMKERDIRIAEAAEWLAERVRLAPLDAVARAGAGE